jgi:hypothetical protein
MWSGKMWSLLHVFKLSLSKGIFPITIFKSGKRNEFDNYKGVAILSCFAKLFEILTVIESLSSFKLGGPAYWNFTLFLESQ